MSLQFPASPTVGQVFPSPLVPGAPSWTWNGDRWVSGGFSGAVVSTSPMPPLNPRVGDLWFDPQEGQTYVWFDDGNSKQWVITINQGGRSPIMGVTDGSDAAPGEVGEFLLSNSAPLSLPVGDWRVTGTANPNTVTSGGTATLTWMLNGVSSGSALALYGATSAISSFMPLSELRVNIATPSTVSLSPTGTGTIASYSIMAWRMR